MKTTSFIHAKSKLGFLNAAAAGLTFTVAMTPLSLQADAWLYNDPATFTISSAFTAPATTAYANRDRITGNTPATIVRVTTNGVLESTTPRGASDAGFQVGTQVRWTNETWLPSFTQYGKLEIVNGGIVNSKHSSIGYGSSRIVSENPNVYADTPAFGEVFIGAGSQWSVSGWLTLGQYRTPTQIETHGVPYSTGRLTLEGGVFEATGYTYLTRGSEYTERDGSVLFGYQIPYFPLLLDLTPLFLNRVRLGGYVELFHSEANSYAEIGTAGGNAGTLAITGRANFNPRGTITLHSNSTYIRTLTSTSSLSDGGIRGYEGTPVGRLEIVDGAKLDVQLDPGFLLTGVVGETIRVAEYTSYALTEWYGAAPGTGHGFNDGASEITIGGHVYEIQYNATGIDLVIVPEPSTYALLGGVGAVALAVGVRWRRRRKG